MPGPIQAVLFDKDGTLTDFHDTWDAALGAGLRASARDEQALAAAAEAIEYDLEAGRMHAGSPVIAGTNALIAELLAPHCDLGVMLEVTLETAGGLVAPAIGLIEALDALAGRGTRLGVATNDDEKVARDQLASMGVADRFECVVGADSGYGAKPEPGMVIGALEQLGVEPAAAAMVGDSSHDLVAARAAGVAAVLVTNSGPASSTLVAEADLVIDTLADLVAGLGMLERAGRAVR